LKRSELAHILRAASRIADETDIVVFGSQSILGSFDEDDLPDAAVGSVEADVTFWSDARDEKADMVDGAIGEGSDSRQMYGYYAQGVSQHHYREAARRLEGPRRDIPELLVRSGARNLP